MTAEDFIIDLDTAARELGPHALRLFVRLMALGIQQRSRFLQIGDRWLMQDLGFSKDAVTTAKLQIRRYIDVEANDGVRTSFILPMPHLMAQPCLFAPVSGRKSFAQVPFSAGQTALPDRADRPSQQGGSALPDRADRPSQQGSAPFQQGHVPFQTGQTALLSRALDTESQQLADAHPPIESSRGLSNTVVLTPIIDRVLRADRLREDQTEDAEELARHLYAFMMAFGPHDKAKNNPDEKILAHCLAIANLGAILAELGNLKRKETCGKAYFWFVVVLCDKLLGANYKLVMQRYDRLKAEKGRTPEQTQIETPNEFLGNVSRLARKIA